MSLCHAYFRPREGHAQSLGHKLSRHGGITPSGVRLDNSRYEASPHWWSGFKAEAPPGNSCFCRVFPVTQGHALSQRPINVTSEQFPAPHRLSYNSFHFQYYTYRRAQYQFPMSALKHSSKRQKMQSSFAPAVDELHTFKRRWAGWTTIESEPVCSPHPGTSTVYHILTSSAIGNLEPAPPRHRRSEHASTRGLRPRRRVIHTRQVCFPLPHTQTPPFDFSPTALPTV